ncbi:hypothetical protein FRC03_002589 [Tulasnella sp. 419]|nr:hypothetical protein FRC02_008676 [Tulasnella sp. 418]KAG8963764.1 hypothetical protein FRC03_002589 [Tulasnella sp. 419]
MALKSQDQSSGDPTPTLLSAVAEAIRSFDASFSPIPNPSQLHLFSSTPADTEILDAILNITNLMTTSLATHIPTQDSKYVSRAQEYTAHADASLQPQIQAHLAYQRAANRPRLYGSDVPLERTGLSDWIISELERLLKTVVSDVFKEKEGDDKVTIICGGKIVVVDIELRKNGQDLLQVTAVKSTHASSDATGSSSVSATVDISTGSLDALLLSSVRSFVNEVQKVEPDCVFAEKLGGAIQNHFKAIMNMDALADSPVNGGHKWFKAVGEIDTIASDVANREAQAIAKSLGLQRAPLDIFLNRAHGLPLTYLSSPSMTFLVQIPAQVYLDLLQSSRDMPPEESIPIDISLPALRSHLLGANQNSRIVTATLALGETHGLSSSSLLTSTFPLLDDAPALPVTTDFGHVGVHFSLPNQHLEHTFPSNATQGFILDFGSLPMRRDAMSHLNEGHMFIGMDPGTAFSSLTIPSWLDLTINPKGTTTSRQYSSTYTSTAHPSLHHMISNPTEPGFLLGKIRVLQMNEVWAILQVVQQQCWLNELMRCFEWKQPGDISSTSDPTAGEELLHVTGGFEPSTIPVQIAIATSTLNVAVRFTMPLPRPGLPILSFSVVHDIRTPRGCRVEFETAPNDLDIITLTAWGTSIEEIIRRGGAACLAGWIWGKAKV